MNKYLLMSAAVVMGTMATGTSQLADAAARHTIAMHPTSLTKQPMVNETYCDYWTYSYCTPSEAHELCAMEHQVFNTSDSPCQDVAAVSGVPAVGYAPEKRAVALADISAPVALHENIPLIYVLSYPFNEVKKGKRKSTFDAWASTNGSTAFLVASGWQGPSVKDGKVIGPTFAKLEGLLKSRQKQ
jgi:hypothetical protein